MSCRNVCVTLLALIVLLVVSAPSVYRFLQQSFLVSPADTRFSQLSVSDEDLRRALEGKSVLVVGGTRGIGRGTAVVLARYGANVAIVGRSEQSGRTAIEMMKEAALHKDSQLLDFYKADFMTVKGVVDFVEELKKKNIKFDHMVVTVAVFPDWKDPYTSSGIEKTVAVNNLGRFVLYKLCLDILNIHNTPEEGPSTRILNVMASGRHPMADFDTELLTGQRTISHLLEALSLVSSVNELIQLELKERWTDKPITLIGTYPGFLKTDLHDNQGIFFTVMEEILHPLIGMQEEEAGYNNAVTLAAPELEGCGGNNRAGLCYIDEDLTVRVLSERYKPIAEKNQKWVWAYLEGLYHKGLL